MVLTSQGRLFFVLCFLLLLLGAESAVGAQSDRVRVVAHKLGTYDLASQTFVGEGDVQVSYEDLILSGERLVWNLETGELHLTGSVSLRQGELEMSGEFLTYNLTTGEGVFKEAEAELRMTKETGTVFFLGEEITLEPDHFWVRGAHLTTCDLPQSHYHLEAKELEVVLGEKAIIRGATYYEGQLPIFYWPYLVIPLDSQRERFFSLPVLGYGEEEGYYIQNTFNYYFNPQAYGHLYLDAFSRLGLGGGARHYYDLKAWGQGSLYLYHLPHQSRRLWKGAWDHSFSRGNWTVKTDNFYENSLKKKAVDSDTRLSFVLPSLTAESWLVYKESDTAKIKRLQEVGGQWRQKLGKHWTLNLKGGFTHRETTEDLRLLEYLGETTYSLDKQTWTLALQRQYNPDLLESSTQLWRSVQRLPELKWEVSDWGLAKLPLQSGLVLGRYEENPSGVQGTRALGQLTLRAGSWRPFKDLSFSYRGDWGGAFYKEQQRQIWLYGRVGLNYRITEALQLTATYNQREVWGSSPFRFDAQKPLQDLSWRLTHRKSAWQTSLRSGYNFKTGQYTALFFQGSWRPQAKWSFDLYGNYDLNTKRPGRVVPLVSYKSADFEAKVGGRFRFDQSIWEQLEAKLSFPLGKTWRISYTAIYQPPREAFTQGLLSAAKDLHCREISFSYDHVQQRIAFQYTIKAFPTLPIGWDSAGGISLFDLEDISEIIGVKE